MRKQKTYYAKTEEVKKNWVLIDAQGLILGKVAAKAAKILRGKEKAEFTPAVDTGDFVVIINADKIKVTGNKEKDKMYYRHSGYPGGLKAISYERLMEKYPTKVLEKAVWGMLPHHTLGRTLIKKLKVYAGENHPHEAQHPKQIVIK